MWGRLLGTHTLVAGLRFTPTRVGTTPPRCPYCGSGEVHPHACGDDAPFRNWPAVERGSPPRVWGRLQANRREGLCHRFTPTRVGTTSRNAPGTMRPSVHPHACGDDPILMLAKTPNYGSPPRVWGRRSRWEQAYCSSRFTPTRVGTTVVLRRASLAGRFTPTRVGTTGPTPRGRRRSAVHPHACGDDVTLSSLTVGNYGSPPRVWGRQSHDIATVSACRFTPTRVGTTCPGTCGVSLPTVHPHACGDDKRDSTRRAARSGSPPRVWGRPWDSSRIRGWLGSFVPLLRGLSFRGHEGQSVELHKLSFAGAVLPVVEPLGIVSRPNLDDVAQRWTVGHPLP